MQKSNLRWAFREELSWVTKDPTEEQFFVPEGHSDALVREVIQNSLDAATSAEAQVQVRFQIGEVQVSSAEFDHLFMGLKSHFEAKENAELLGEFDWTRRTRVPVLVVEDFGTGGLIGDVSQSVVLPDGTRNDFFYFFRNVGRSGKSDSDRGRWGLGKTVFPAASQLRSFFALSNRASANGISRVLMGQASLRNHTLGNRTFGAYGFFAELVDGQPMPATDDEALCEFSSRFGLKRGDKTGLSVVVPFPLASISAAAIARSVVIHFFLPILESKLVVTVEGDSLPEPVTIDASTIRTLPSKPWWRGTGKKAKAHPPFDFALWSIEKAVDRTVLTDGLEWSEARVPSGQLSTLRSRFAQGERLAFKVPVKVCQLKGTPQDSWFEVFLQRAADVTRPEEYYIRGGMTISGIRVLKEPGVRGMVVVRDAIISRLLGDAENPAHTEWPERGTRVGQRYDKGPSTVSFVKKSLAELARILSLPAEDIERDLLQDVFFVEEQGDRRTVARKGRSGMTTPPKPGPIPPATPQRFSVRQVQGGFVVEAGAEPLVPQRLRICAGYDVRRGNPLRVWQPLDFDFGQNTLNICASGGTIVSRRGNEIDFVPSTPEFRLEISGFDPNRDLKVSVREVTENLSGTSGVRREEEVDP